MSTTTLEKTSATERQPVHGRGRTLSIYTGYLLQRHVRGAAIWALGVAAYIAMIILVFPSVQGAVDINAYPEALRQAFNFTSMDRIQPFLAGEIFSYMPLVLAFFPMTMLASAIAGAEERGTLDVLLGTPLPRRHLVIANFVAAAAMVLAIVLLAGAVSWLVGLMAGVDLPASDAFAGTLNLWPITLAFGGLALLASALVRQRSVALGVPVAVMFAMYLIDVVGKLASGAADLRVISAFRYYGNAISDGISWGGFVGLSLAAIILAALAVVAFDRRDIYT